MAKQKGSLKTGGRKKGVANKVTRSLKERIDTFLQGKWGQIEKDINKLDPVQRVAMYERLLRYILPIQKETSVDMSISKLNDEQVNDLLARLISKDNDPN